MTWQLIPVTTLTGSPFSSGGILNWMIAECTVLPCQSLVAIFNCEQLCLVAKCELPISR
jgi:hypothetical protein